MSKSIIRQLMDNEKPFGLMSEEMQEKSKEIERGAGDWFQHFLGRVWNNVSHIVSFNRKTTYRLRDTYTEELEIVECEITFNETYGVWGYESPLDSGSVVAESARSCRGFRLIGFKFDNCDSVHPYSISYNFNGTLLNAAKIYHIESGESKVLHATYVLFRRQT